MSTFEERAAALLGNVRALTPPAPDAPPENKLGLQFFHDFDGSPPEPSPTLTLREATAKARVEYIGRVLDHVGGSVTRAAELLQCDRVTVHRMIRRYGLKAHR